VSIGHFYFAQIGHYHFAATFGEFASAIGVREVLRSTCMSSARRKKLRRLVWTGLIITLLWDGWLEADAISPGGCWLGFDMFGRIIESRSAVVVWLPIVGLVLLQGILVLALIRLREPSSAGPMFHPPEENVRR
jgi:hypothetical protein